MDPASAAQSFLLPPIWTPEWGFHWDMLGNYFLGLFFFGGHLKSLVDTFFEFLKSMVNKIHFKVRLPVVGMLVVDFSKYTWDDQFFDYVRDKIKMKVTAKESEAKRVKMKYLPLLEETKTSAERAQVMQKYYEEMEGVTKDTLDEVKSFHPEIWKAAVARYKDEALAEKWLISNIKAGVVEKKNGSASNISMTEKVKNLSTTEGASNA